MDLDAVRLFPFGLLIPAGPFDCLIFLYYHALPAATTNTNVASLRTCTFPRPSCTASSHRRQSLLEAKPPARLHSVSRDLSDDKVRTFVR